MRHRRLGARSSGRRRRGRPSGPGWRSSCRRCYEVVDHYRDRGVLTPVDGGQPIDEVTEALIGRARPTTGARPSDVVTRKTRAEIERMAAPARVVAEVLDPSRPSSGRASRPPSSTRIAEEHIRAAGAIPSFIGYPGSTRAAVPGQRLHLDRRRGRPRHPGRADDPRRPDRVGRRRRDRRRLARRRRPDVLSSATSPPDGRRAGRGDPRGDDGRASRRPCPGNHIERHLGRRRGRRARGRATASSARSSATASAPRCTRSRRSPTTGPAARARRLEAGPVPGHRADVHARRATRRGSRPTAGPCVTADGTLAAHFEHTHRGHRRTGREILDAPALTLAAVAG